jgi:hypothetical protein
VIGLEFWKVTEEADKEAQDRQLRADWTTKSLVQD